MGRWTRPHRGRAHNGRRGRDRIYRIFWTGVGDQYAGELPPPRVDANSWRVHVAAMWSPAGGLSDWRPRSQGLRLNRSVRRRQGAALWIETSRSELLRP